MQNAIAHAEGSSRGWIVNPVLRGAHPDPSMLRVGDDFYLATSTFEWFPGVRLHHSRDLVRWEPKGYALTRTSQLDLRGNPPSGGVWAPALSYDDGLFYLLYTNVRGWGGRFLDARNYLVIAPRVEGPWSDPVFLHASGFDPSMFHDEGGRKWVVSMAWDPRRLGPEAFGGIVLQEYAPAERRLVGEPRLILEPGRLPIAEGPHLFRRGGYFYLLVAEGGTGWDHAATLLRARRIEGPYEVDPRGPFLTSRGDPDGVLQKAGHASLVETRGGEAFVAFLCGRPVGPQRRCILGRETALERVRWTEDGWLRLASGGVHPAVRVPGPALPRGTAPPPPTRDDFDEVELAPHWQTLRAAADPSWLALGERRGFLRLRGRESLTSRHEPSVVARRVESLRCRVETALSFSPSSFHASAGLVFYYDEAHFYFLHVTTDRGRDRCLKLLASDGGVTTYLLAEPIALPATGTVRLSAELSTDVLRFAYAVDDGPFVPLGIDADATILSDEHAYGELGFTGTFVGLCAQDLRSHAATADFDYFEYAEVGDV